MLLAKLGKVIGYVKAPRARMMARHPVKGTKALLAAKGAKGLVTTWPGAVLGAMVALPFGAWALVRRAFR